MTKIKCEVSGIQWDYDEGEEENLPTEDTIIINHPWDDITDEEVADIISDELSDRYGHLHFGFCIDDFELTKGE